MKNYILFIIFIILFSSCKTVINVKKGKVKNQQLHDKEHYLVGIAREKITPFPGHSMGGFGNELSKVSRGWWNHLYATSNYIEDKKGNILIMVSTDLWSVSWGLVDQAIHYLHEEGAEYKIAKESIMISATHTHNSPGNMSSSWGYNQGSSAVSGFDKELFHYLAKMIAKSIKKSIDQKRPAYLTYNQSSLPGLARNRSLKAFLNNEKSERDEILKGVTNPSLYFNESIICYAYDLQALQAIDPLLSTISVYSADQNQLMGIMTFFGVHPTAMGFSNPLISSDLFGVARTTVENVLTDGNPLICFFNGAEGDVSANWNMQNRENTERLGKALAQGILATYNDPESKTIKGDINVSLEFAHIRNNDIEDEKNELEKLGITEKRLVHTPVVGKSTLNGTEDGRTNRLPRDQECFYDESITIPGTDAHGSKKPHEIARLAAGAIKDEIPLGRYEIGKVRIAAIPGEPTVTLSNRLKNALNAPENGMGLVVSLANEYLSYFTTPQEYMKQHYEGGFTVFGVASGIFLEEQLKLLENIYIKGAYGGRKTYTTGFAINKNQLNENLKKEWTGYKELDHVYHIIRNENRYHQFTIHKQFSYHNWNPIEDRIKQKLPSVRVEVELNNGWDLLVIENENFADLTYLEPQNDERSNNFLTYVSTNAEEDIRWEVRWMIPDHYHSDKPHRIVVDFHDSKPFIQNIDTF